MSRILIRFPSLHGDEFTLKYADTLNDWIELPADDLDLFVDMIETGKDSGRDNNDNDNDNVYSAHIVVYT